MDLKPLKPTQKEVLRVLYMNRGKKFNSRELKKACPGVNSNHLESAVSYFLNVDYVYQPDADGRIEIAPDGESAYIDECM
jgi:hypothetical protein